MKNNSISRLTSDKVDKENIFVNRKVWNKYSEEEMNEYIDRVFMHYRQQGFPYYSTDKNFRDKEFNKLKNFNLDRVEIKRDNKIYYSQVMHGLSLCWSYFPHSWEIACNGFRLTPMKAFKDDDIFKKVIIKRIKMGDYISDSGIRKMLKIYSGVQSVSNFRPSVAGAIYNRFIKSESDKILDMSSGFGGRLFGFIISKAKNYIGLEPSQKTYTGLEEIKEDYGKDKNIELIKIGSEDYIPEKNSLDLCFTSPPYFNNEMYSDELTQSYIKYPDKNSWIEYFLKRTFENCYYGLKRDKFMLINIANVKSFKNLEAESIRVAKEVGFEYIDLMYYLQSSLSHKEKFKSEPIFIFKKS